MATFVGQHRTFSRPRDFLVGAASFAARYSARHGVARPGQRRESKITAGGAPALQFDQKRSGIATPPSSPSSCGGFPNRSDEIGGGADTYAGDSQKHTQPPKLVRLS